MLQRRLRDQFKRQVKTTQRYCCGWTNTSPHPSKQSLGSKEIGAVPINFCVGYGTGTRILQRTSMVNVRT